MHFFGHTINCFTVRIVSSQTRTRYKYNDARIPPPPRKLFDFSYYRGGGGGRNTLRTVPIFDLKEMYMYINICIYIYILACAIVTSQYSCSASAIAAILPLIQLCCTSCTPPSEPGKPTDGHPTKVMVNRTEV